MSEAPRRPTLAAIKAALERLGTHASRRLGQNFLTDPRVLARIVDAAAVGEGSVVLEVGPGPGTLTAELLARGCRVIAIEVDRKMVLLSRLLVGEHERLEVFEMDALAERPAPPAVVRAALARFGGAHYSFVANLPYQIASPLIVDLLWFLPPKVAVVMVQKEVGERLVAAPASDGYGPLSVLVQLAARVETVLTLKPAAFWPPPAVDSRCVRLTPGRAPQVDALGFPIVRAVVQAAFHARRKRLKNSLASGLAALLPAAELAGRLDEKKFDCDRRAETLAPMEFLELAEHLAPLLHGPLALARNPNSDVVSE